MTKLRTTGFFLLFVILLVTLVNLVGAQESPTDTKGTVFQQESLSGSALVKSAEETPIELSTDRHALVHMEAEMKLSPSGVEAAQEAANPLDLSLVNPLDEWQDFLVLGESSPKELQVDFTDNAPRIDLAGTFVGFPQSSPTPSAAGETCQQLLGNTELNAPGGSIAPWVIIAQNIYGSTTNFVSSPHSIFVADNDPDDDTPLFDAFGQAFSMPSNLTSVTIKYATASVNSNTGDNAGGELYTLDAGGSLDQLLDNWEVGESPDTWQWQVLEYTNQNALAAMEGKDLFIGFFNETTASSPDERVYFDDITVTACQEDAPNSYIIVKKETDPAGATQKFTFDPSWSGSNFQLIDGQSRKSPALAPGTYKVVESVPSGWALESATCSDGSSPNSISLSKGETVTCTFRNKKLPISQSCSQLLVNSKLDIVEFGDGTGTAEPWAILDPIVYYIDDPDVAYDGYSLFFEDGDGDDPNPTQDSLAQAFQMPQNLTEMRIEYQRATVNTNTGDKVFGNLWLLDDNWVLDLDNPDNFVMSWEVGQEEATWVNESGSWNDAGLLNKMNGRKMAIFLFSDTDNSGDGEIVLFDDVKLTACTKKAATTGRVYMPVVLKNYGKATGPICNPPNESPADQWYSDRGLVQTNATCNSTLSNVDTADYYTFKPTASGNHTLRLTNLPEGSEWAAMIFFDQTSPDYAPGGASDGRCRITDPGNDPKQVICNLDKNKDYFVKVSAGSTPMAGSYQMRITKP